MTVREARLKKNKSMLYLFWVLYMNLIRDKWDSDSYNEFIEYLFNIRDIKYRDFHSKLGVGNNVIGVRTPLLKKIAKDIYKGNYIEFLELLEEDYYEEVTLYGLIVCNIKDFDTSIRYLDIYKNKINNWASCDLFCSSYKIINKYKDYYWKYINDNIGSDNLWIKRMCFVLIISYYIEDKYLDNIFMLCDKYNTNEYYVQMAVAWLISICYIKCRDKTLEYIKNNKLDDFTHNKAIQKVRESYRVDIKDKEYLNSLKRK